MTRSRRPFPDPAPALPPHLRFVLGLSPSAMTLGLSNMRALMDRLGHPESGFRSVLVAGTNGKGSVTTMLASILSRCGLRTGRYISPHVFSVVERIAIDGELVSLDEMEAAAARVAPLHDQIPFSYFEALTAIAFLVFANRGVDVAVLEVGLGGRFDATNVVEPEVAIVTSISLDHRRILGDTEEEILREKLGVARRAVPLLVGELAPGLRAIADERGARTGFEVLGPTELGEASVVEEFLGGVRLALRTRRADYGVVRVRFGGRHQATNALLAVAAAECLLGATDARVAEGLEAATIAGRFQCVERAGRTVVLDVAHNDAALAVTADHLAAFRSRGECAIVFGLLRRKELFEAPRRLLNAAGCLCLVEPEAEPGSIDLAFPPHELLGRYFAPHLPNTATDVMLWNRSDATDSLARAVRWLDGDGRRFKVVLATGSHRVVAEFGNRVLAGGTTGGGR